MQEHYKRFLKSDYNLLMVESARYGLQMLNSLPVDMILYNVEQDREIEAVAMLHVFRRATEGADISIIAMTGYSVSPERALLKKAGFDAYLSRPFTLRKLRETIAMCMARRTVSILNKIDLSVFAGQTS
jgi:response regulator RpfG family c-di-GMP phosphodiesterase